MRISQTARPGASVMGVRCVIGVGAIVMGLSAPGCATDTGPRPAVGPAPAWLARPNDGPEGLLVAVGSGPTRAKAVDAAHARLAQSIIVRVRSEETARTSGVVRESTESTTTGAAATRVDSTVRLISDVTLPGVRVVEVWPDRPSGLWHARVTLDRAEAGRRFRADVDAALEDARAALAAPSIDALAPLRRARRARSAVARAREALDTLEPIAGPDPRRRAALQRLAHDVETMAAHARQTSSLAVHAADTGSAPLAQRVEARLRHLGAAVDPRAPAALILVGLTREPAVAFRPDLRLDRWTAEVRVVDARSRATLARWVGSGVTHGDGAARLPDDLRDWLNDLVGD